MRTALALTMLVAGAVAIRTAFAPVPDPRVVIAGFFGGGTAANRGVPGGSDITGSDTAKGFTKGSLTDQKRTSRATDDGRYIP